VCAADDDADKSAGDNVHLSVTIDETDYDIRSETGASVDGDHKEDKDAQQADDGNTDTAASATAEGSLCSWLSHNSVANVWDRHGSPSSMKVLESDSGPLKSLISAWICWKSVKFFEVLGYFLQWSDNIMDLVFKIKLVKNLLIIYF